MIVDSLLIPEVRGERAQPFAGSPLSMTHDIGNHEHLRQSLSKRLKHKVDTGALGTAGEQRFKAVELAHIGTPSILYRARPAAHLSLEQTGEGKDKRLRRLIGSIIVDLRRRPIEKLIKAIGLPGLKLRMGRQLVHDGQDHAIEEPPEIGLKDPG